MNEELQIKGIQARFQGEVYSAEIGEGEISLQYEAGLNAPQAAEQRIFSEFLFLGTPKSGGNGVSDTQIGTSDATYLYDRRWTLVKEKESTKVPIKLARQLTSEANEIGRRGLRKYGANI